MLYLKKAPGKYLVGATTFVLPLDACRRVGDAKVNAGDALHPALSLEEVAFTAYYPARVDERSKYGLNWIPRHV
jgi:platelet-activating factor acetylhydrolase